MKGQTSPAGSGTLWMGESMKRTKCVGPIHAQKGIKIKSWAGFKRVDRISSPQGVQSAEEAHGLRQLASGCHPTSCACTQ